jgi:hypothetical protein
MSLYNLLFGINRFAPLLLSMIQVRPDEVPRFRDCYLERSGKGDEYEIVVYTRTGGGNRAAYDSPQEHRDNCDYADCKHEGPFNSGLRAKPTYRRDHDAEFDSTYALFYFGVPGTFLQTIVKDLAEAGAEGDPVGRWKDLIDKLDKGDTSDPRVARAQEVGREIVAKIDALAKDKRK